MILIDGDNLLTVFPVDDEPFLTKSCVRMTIQHMTTIEPDVQILSSLLAELTHKERTDRYHVWTTTEVKQWIADKITEMKNDG